MSLAKGTQGIVTEFPNLAIVNSQEKTHRAENSQAETGGGGSTIKFTLKNRRNFILIKFINRLSGMHL